MWEFPKLHLDNYLTWNNLDHSGSLIMIVSKGNFTLA